MKYEGVVYRERIFLLPKEGTLGEDRFSRSPRRGVWVLCDGASEGYDGGGWARALSRSAARFSSLRRVVASARKCQSMRCFTSSFGDADSDWVTVLARNKGSYSTLLRLRVFPRTVEVEGIGDSVVFFLKGYEIVYGFPAREAEFFQRDPLLIGDRPLGEIPPSWAASFPWRKRRITSFLLVTDALALFLVSLGKEEQRRILALLHRGRENQIREVLAKERQGKRIRWDDLSYLWLDLRPAGNRAGCHKKEEKNCLQKRKLEA